ncbi:PglD-related sugar-binding protein [Roseobacter sp. HKCCD7870]|uniref:PglD-related sugar-binding protein n=1 Tax=Roseobacter sp. HKCCD7870 TaxID=3120343 RepID=UPI0030EF001B
MNLLLVGAGGHARPVTEAAELMGHQVVGYAAPEKSTWCSAPRIADGEPWPADADGCVIGIGGGDVVSLMRRGKIAKSYSKNGATPFICHPAATLSAYAFVSKGAVVLAGAVVNAAAEIGAFAIINTGAIVEHDARIAEGAHVAPGAIVLGGAIVGKFSMIASGAVVLPGAEVPSGTLVPALSYFGGRIKSCK